MYLSLNIQNPQPVRYQSAALRPNVSWMAVGSDMLHSGDKCFTESISEICILFKKNLPTC